MTAVLEVRYQEIPQELRAIDRWVIWRLEERDGKPTKVPFTTAGKRASSTAPGTWTSFDAAVACYQRGGATTGIGFVLTDDDDLVGVDLDRCRDPETGEVAAWALAIVEQINSYTEISPSGRGLRIIAHGALPADGRKRGAIEVYENKRFLTITGHRLDRAPATIEQRPAALAAFHGAHFPPAPAAAAAGNGSPQMTDSEILELIRRARNGAKFDELYRGGDNGHASASEADLALCSILAFYTRDEDQLDRIFRGSGRMRAKWDRADYRARTIGKALAGVTDTYTPPPPVTIVERVDRESLKRMAGEAVDERDRAAPAGDDQTDDVVCLADIVRERVSWLWPGRLANGKLAILEGDPERAKSTVTLDLAARVSTGSPMPDGHRPDGPAGVLVVCAEDDVADTIIPRLLAHGADLSKVHTLKLRRDENGRLIPLAIPEGLPLLEGAIKRAGARLVVVDPITAYLSEDIHTHNDASVRRALTPLADIAQRLRAAIVLVRHLNKDASQKKALYRGGGSIAFSGAVRSVLVAERHPYDDDLIVLARVKNNLATYVPSLGYRIRSNPEYECPKIVWQTDPVDITADELLAGGDARYDAPAREEAEEVLRTILADGPKDAKQVSKLAGDAGVSPATLDRAKASLGVRAQARRTQDGRRIAGWTWALPHDAISRSPTANLDALEGSRGQDTPRASRFGSGDLENPSRPLCPHCDAISLPPDSRIGHEPRCPTVRTPL